MGDVLCVIPARGGSKRIPHKNIALFKGKPMLSYSITAAFESGIATEVMVSTEDYEIAEVAKRYGAKVPFMRSIENANDMVGIADVLIEVIENYRKQGQRWDYILCILATAPLIDARNIEAAFRRLKENKEADSICSVEKYSYPPQRALRMEKGKLVMLHPEFYYARTQDLEPIYHDCGQFFIFRTEALLRDKKLYTENMLPFFLNPINSQDVDTMEDLAMAELKFERLRERG